MFSNPDSTTRVIKHENHVVLMCAGHLPNCEGLQQAPCLYLVLPVGGEDGIPICYAKSGDDNGQNMTITRVDCSDETATFDARTVTVGELLSKYSMHLGLL